LFKKPVIIIISIVYIIFLLSCGVEEYYYLPQVPESNNQTELNTNATLNIPPIPDDYYYAGYYTIFYRIYVSNYSTQSSSSSEFSLISSNLSSDYNYLLPITNPVNTSATVSVNTFKNRNFFELEFDGTDNVTMLPKTGGTLVINFPTSIGGIPTASIDNGENINIIRSSKLISPEPTNDLYFRNTAQLRDVANANNNKNADVAGRAGENMNYTYAAMYIVAVGTNPSNFTTVYSKPTFINVFRLP
jgi:hypothetical protein